MKCASLGPAVTLVALVIGAVTGTSGIAHADDPYGLGARVHAPPAAAVTTWGTSRGQSSLVDATSVTRDAPVTRAREMLTRARLLDEAAALDERSATELVAKLTTLRAAAKVARERADKAGADERELLGARVDDLEADIVVSEAEITFKRRTAADNRRVARELRLRAVRLAREAPAWEASTAAASCDPPFRFTTDGRKIYRLECLE